MGVESGLWLMTLMSTISGLVTPGTLRALCIDSGSDFQERGFEHGYYWYMY